MTHTRRVRGRRAAFTLVEMVVVIAIIAILVALVAAAVLRALPKGPELQTRSEIALMEQKLTSVQNLPGHEAIPPSALHLSKRNKYNPANALDAATIKYLSTRFGRHACYDFKPLSGGTFIDWNGDDPNDPTGANPAANEELYLEGEQCLVFHLGGVPTRANGLIRMVGFSQNEQNPAQAIASQGELRQGPYFEFQTNRLQDFTSPNSTGAFPFYVDPWGAGKPYAFFASSSTTGGGAYLNDFSPAVGDCPSLGVAPYFQSVNNGVVQFLNPNSFQIISAGPNGAFGPGGMWNPGSGYGSGVGVDDQSNFSPHPLGSAAQ